MFFPCKGIFRQSHLRPLGLRVQVFWPESGNRVEQEQSLNSKRVVTGILTILFMAAYNYLDLVAYGVTEETGNGRVITVTALIVSDTLRPSNTTRYTRL